MKEALKGVASNSKLCEETKVFCSGLCDIRNGETLLLPTYSRLCSNAYRVAVALEVTPSLL